jgi:hypothetical protein
MRISFHAADVPLPRFKKKKTSAWIQAIAKKHKTDFLEVRGCHSWHFALNRFLRTRSPRKKALMRKNRGKLAYLCVNKNVFTWNPPEIRVSDCFHVEPQTRCFPEYDVIVVGAGHAGCEAAAAAANMGVACAVGYYEHEHHSPNVMQSGNGRGGQGPDCS